MWAPASIREDVPVTAKRARFPRGLMDRQMVQSEQGVFTQWGSQSVILQVASADLRVPLRGVIVGETEHSVRFRIHDGCDIDIYKHMILAVEEESWMDSIT